MVDCRWCDLRALPEKTRMRMMLVVLLIIGVVEYGVDIAENYIIAKKSTSDEYMYQYSSSILSIFSQVFILVNTGFLTMLTTREAAMNEGTTNKTKQNVSKIFHFGCATGLGSGIVVAVLLLALRPQFFSMLGESQYSGRAATFFYIRVPFIPIEYMTNVLSSALTGLMQIQPLLIASIVSNLSYIPVLIGLMHFMDDKVAAIGWANAFQIMVSFISFLVVLSRKAFRDKYEIFDFSIYSRRGTTAKSPLLNEEEELPKDPSTVGEMGKAAGLLFIKNSFATAASVCSTIVLAAVLPENDFVANNVLSNTFQLAGFAAYFNVVLNIFGPRAIAAGNIQRYMAIFQKAHINIILLGGLSILGLLFVHTGSTAIKNLTDSENSQDVRHILTLDIWIVWMVGKVFSMYVNLYDTIMISFQKYEILGFIGIFNAVVINIPITLVSAYKYKSLLGIIAAGVASYIVEFLVTGYLFHFKYYPKFKAASDAKVASYKEQISKHSQQDAVVIN